jgi:6-pyruvoyltetrahydropterin/6-carboxytetrahydropterin synthase
MGELERRLASVHSELDHRLLNEVEGLDLPTMENIASFVWDRLMDLPNLHRVTVKRQQNGEGCEFYGPVETLV